MGVVFRARQISLNRLVAVKMIASGELASPEFVQRFHLEAEAAAGLQHPNVVAIHEVGVHEGQHFYSMDYVEGQTLAERAVNNPLPPELAADYLKTIAEAVHYAHQRGILHRDLKPSNVLIDSLDRPHLTDFGLAKRLTGDSDLTLTGQLLGSPNYMPPEQALGQRQAATIACDVYSLGAILYFLLTGRPPFAAQSMTETLQQVLHSEPVSPQVLNPAVPRDLETICLKCLSKEPPRRYSSAQELADDLGRFLKGEPVQARPVGATGKAWRWCRRNPVVASFGGATGVLLLAVTIGSPIAAFRINRERKATETALGEVKNQQRLASEQELLARRRFYAAQISLAGQAAESQDLARCVELLETQRPEPGKEDLRTFEWYHLWSICHAWHYLTLEGHYSPVYALSFSPDGSTLASASYGDIRLWDVFSGHEKAALKCRPRMIYSALAFTPHGESLIAGSWDGIVRLWEASTTHLRAIIPAHGSYIRSLSLSPNGKCLATGAEDGSFKIWEAGSWNEQTNIRVGRIAVSALAFSPDGRTLASEVGWGGDDGVKDITLWDLTQGVPSARLKLPGGSGTLTFSPDSKTLATSPWQSIELWDSTTGKTQATLKGHQARVNAIAFVWNGNAIASCAGDRTVRLWPLSHSNADTRVESVLLGEHLASVLCLAASPDGKLLASGANDGSIKLWNVAQTPDEALAQAASDFQLKPEAHGVGLRSLQFLPDGQTLVAVTAGGTVSRNILLGEDSGESPAAGECGTVSPEGKLLATGRSDGTITLWNYAQGRLLNSVRGHVSKVCATAFSPDGSILATCAFNDHTIRAWSVSGGLKPLWTRKTEAVGITALTFAPDGKTLAAALRHWPVSFLDSSTGTAHGVHTVKARGFMEVYALAYSPDGKFLAMAGDEGTVKLWNVLTGTLHIELRGHSLAVRAVAYSPDGRTIATASDDRTVRLWDPVTGQERMTFKGFNSSARSVTFSSDGNTLAAGSPDGLVGFWRARHTAEPLRLLAPRHLDSANTGREEIPLLLKALERSKTTLSFTVYNYLAWSCVTGPKEIQSPEKALPLALKAVELDKTGRETLNTLGVVYYRLGRFTNALEVFERDSKNPDPLSIAFDRLFEAMSYQKLGDFAKAESCYARATKWLDENAASVPPDSLSDLKGFRAEAEEVLGKRKQKSRTVKVP
jgi:WD40 repeat protein